MTLTPPLLRRRALAGLTGALVLGAAACSGENGSGSSDVGGQGDGQGSGEGGGGAELLPAAEGTTEYPLTLTTWLGESVLEQRPARIATVGFSVNIDVLQALGVTPTYTITEDAEYAWRDQEWFAGIEVVDTATRRDPINVEGIAASAPDLIIAMNSLVDEGEYEKLLEIAPVLDVATSEELGDQFDWRAAQQLVGTALDLQAAAQAVVEQADQAIADVAAAHPEFEGRTITIGTDYGGQYELEYYTTPGSAAEGVMVELGFVPNPLAENFTEDAVVSSENMGLLDADVLVISYADEATRSAREEQALFQELPPVTDGRYASLTTSAEDSAKLLAADGTEVENPTWVLRRGASAVSVPWAVDVVANQWLAGVDLG